MRLLLIGVMLGLALFALAVIGDYSYQVRRYQ